MGRGKRVGVGGGATLLHSSDYLGRWVSLPSQWITHFDG